jgi:methyl-accepting chemotaxis protein
MLESSQQNSSAMPELDVHNDESPKRTMFLPLVTFTIIVLALCAIFISYHLPSSASTLTLLWITLLSIGLTATVAFVLSRQMQKDYSEPLSQLSQSIANIASGHENTPIWGQERTDPVGEAARAAEKARKHWVNTPDMLLDMPDGSTIPVRFNGATAPLFARMQQQIESAVGQLTKTSTQMQAGVDAHQAGVRGFAERLHLTLQGLTNAAQESTERLDLLHGDIAERLQLTLQQLHHAAHEGSDKLNLLHDGFADRLQITLQQLQTIALQGNDKLNVMHDSFSERLHAMLQQLTTAAEEGNSRLTLLHDNAEYSNGQLRLSQQQALDQFLNLLPQLEQRTDGLNEIVRLTGQQAATTLQQLQHSSHLIREAAQYNQTVGQKFAGESDDLSQRLFAAVNLLRSSGKVLSETNELARSRMHEILTTMTQAENALTQTLNSTHSRITLTADMANMIADLSVRTENNASMMATAVDGLLQHNASLTEQVDVSGKRLDSMLANVDNLQQKFASAVATVTTRSEQIEHVLRHLHSQHERLMAELARNGGDNASTLGKLALESEQLIARIEAQLALAGAIADTELRRLGEATAAAAESAQVASNQLTQATQLLLAGGTRVETVADGMAGQLARLDREIGNSLGNLDRDIGASLGNLDREIGSSLGKVAERTDKLASKSEERLDAVYTKVEEMSLRLNALSQLTNTMASVASQLAELIPQIGDNHAASEHVGELRQDMYAVVKDLLEWQKTINASLHALPAHIQQEMGGNLEQNLMLIRGQLEATRQDMMASVSEQQHGFGRRLDSLEEVSSFVADNVTAPKPDAGQMATALRGIVLALSQINSQLHDFDQRLPVVLGSGLMQQPEQHVDQALDAVTDIFSSLRDRGDNVINRLNDMARHLQSAADKIHKEG